MSDPSVKATAHHWKWMGPVAVVLMCIIVIALFLQQFIVATVLSFGFAVIALQWLTVDS